MQQPRFKVGDEPVIAFFREHSIPTSISGVVTEVEGHLITIRALDGWTNEMDDDHVRVPESDVEWDG